MTSKTIDFENADKDTPEDVIRGHSGMAWNICNVGEEGTCVIFGHGNRKHLKPLKDVELGETIKIKSQGIEYLYLIELIVSSKTMNSWQYRLQQGSICWFQLVIRFITQDAHHKSMCYGERWNKGLIRSPESVKKVAERHFLNFHRFCLSFALPGGKTRKARKHRGFHPFWRACRHSRNKA